MLDGLPVATLTPATLLAVAVFFVLTGRLIPKSTYQEKKDECDRWRLAYETERDARQVSDMQTVELLELAKTTHALISAIVSIPQQSGGRDVSKAPQEAVD